MICFTYFLLPNMIPTLQRNPNAQRDNFVNLFCNKNTLVLYEDQFNCMGYQHNFHWNIMIFYWNMMFSMG